MDLSCNPRLHATKYLTSVKSDDITKSGIQSCLEDPRGKLGHQMIDPPLSGPRVSNFPFYSSKSQYHGLLTDSKTQPEQMPMHDHILPKSYQNVSHRTPFQRVASIHNRRFCAWLSKRQPTSSQVATSNQRAYDRWPFKEGSLPSARIDILPIKSYS